MYGGHTKSAVVPTAVEGEKRAVKVLGGMKIHNSHLKRVQIGDDLVDVPKIEYIQLLEAQIKESRLRLREAELKIARLGAAQINLSADVRDLKRELHNKVNLR